MSSDTPKYPTLDHIRRSFARFINWVDSLPSIDWTDWTIAEGNKVHDWDRPPFEAQTGGVAAATAPPSGPKNDKPVHDVDECDPVWCGRQRIEGVGRHYPIDTPPQRDDPKLEHSTRLCGPRWCGHPHHLFGDGPYLVHDPRAEAKVAWRNNVHGWKAGWRIDLPADWSAHRFLNAARTLATEGAVYDGAVLMVALGNAAANTRRQEEFHRPAEPPDPICHWHRKDGTVMCGQRYSMQLSSNSITAVTCRECRHAIEKYLP